MSAAGKVYIVGAGPGDPGLITVRAQELIAQADAILHDRLIPSAVLRGARPDALLEYAGKEHSGDSAKQGAIEARMIELAEAGKTVVRLKGGDPLVFGRGGEEAAALAARGIDFEIVPGVTAGVAAAAYAGIPVTHRDHASAVAFVTGHEDPTKPESNLDWQALAAFPGTLVFYMGVKNIARVTQRLIEHGRNPEQPAAMIERGTTALQRTIKADLQTIAQLAVDAEITPPALTVIGDVVGERERIAWFEQRPLFGKSVVVTRTRAHAGELAGRLATLGAAVIELPTLSTQERQDTAVADAIATLARFDCVAFTSAAGVESFFAALKRAGKDARALGGLEFAVVGRATAAALAAHGIVADQVAAKQTGAGLAEQLIKSDQQGRHFLLAVAAEPHPALADGLKRAGLAVEQVAFYDTVREPLDAAQLEQIAGADFVTFASGSAVDSLVESAGGAQLLGKSACISIGPTTSAALRDHGVEPAAEAAVHDIDGLLDVLLELAVSRPGRP